MSVVSGCRGDGRGLGLACSVLSALELPSEIERLRFQFKVWDRNAAGIGRLVSIDCSEAGFRSGICRWIFLWTCRAISCKLLIIKVSNIRPQIVIKIYQQIRQVQQMASLNDENKRKVEQKYQKFKASQLQNSSPLALSPNKAVLSQIDQNQGHRDGREKEEDDSYKKLLKLMPKNDKILSMMLSDPSIYEISEALKKEAEERNMMRLIEEFPERYKNLLETEAKFKVMERMVRQKSDDKDREIQLLMERFLKVEQMLKEQASLNAQQTQQQKQSQTKKFHELTEQIRKRELLIHDLKQTTQITQKKYSKIKEDYKNSNAIILQLREQEEQNMRETGRLVEKLKDTEEKLVRANKRLLEYQGEKKIELRGIENLYGEKIVALGEEKLQLEQLLEQANVRVEYKESLLKMTEADNERTIVQLEEELAGKHKEIQALREDHLEALKTIDELEQRVNSQEQQIVRDAQLWVLEKEELRKQLEKSHQLGGELKAELQVKTELVRMLQKSLQCLKTSFDTDITQKTNEWLQTNRQLSTTRRQLLQTAEQLSSVQQQLINQKEASESTLRKYLDRIVEQEERYCQLRERIQQWVQGYGEGERAEEGKREDGGEIAVGEKMERYERIIEKMRKQIIALSGEQREKSEKGAKIVQQLITQNRELRKQLQLQPSTPIKLF